MSVGERKAEILRRTSGLDKGYVENQFYTGSLRGDMPDGLNLLMLSCLVGGLELTRRIYLQLEQTRNDEELARYLSETDYKGNNPWVYAIFSDDADVITFMFREPFTNVKIESVDPNFPPQPLYLFLPEDETITLLHCLARCKTTTDDPSFYGVIVRLLAEAGLDLSILSGHGYNALHLCIGFNNPELLEQILAFDSSFINNGNYRGMTPLFETVQKVGFALEEDSSRIRCTRILLRYGADVNIPDKDDWTPLMYALDHTVYGGHPELVHDIIELLIEFGADIFYQNKSEYMVYDLCLDSNAHYFLKIILERNEIVGKLNLNINNCFLGRYPLQVVQWKYIENNLEHGQEYTTHCFDLLIKHGSTFDPAWILSLIRDYYKKEIPFRKRILKLADFYFTKHFNLFVGKSLAILHDILTCAMLRELPLIVRLILDNASKHGVKQDLLDVQSYTAKELLNVSLNGEKPARYCARRAENTDRNMPRVICSFCKPQNYPQKYLSRYNSASALVVCDKCLYLKLPERRWNPLTIALRMHNAIYIKLLTTDSELHRDAGLTDSFIQSYIDLPSGQIPRRRSSHSLTDSMSYKWTRAEAMRK